MSRAPASAAATSPTFFATSTNAAADGERIDGGLLREDVVGERFETGLLGEGRAGATFRTIRRVEVLELGQRDGSGDGGLERIGEEVPLRERLDDGLAASLELDELGHAVADGGDGDLVEAAGDLLPVTRDERHGAALGEQFGGGGHLARRDVQLGGDAVDEAFLDGHGARCLAADAEGASDLGSDVLADGSAAP